MRWLCQILSQQWCSFILPLHYIHLINLVTSYFSDSDYSVFINRLLLVTCYQSDIVVGGTLFFAASSHTITDTNYLQLRQSSWWFNPIRGPLRANRWPLHLPPSWSRLPQFILYWFHLRAFWSERTDDKFPAINRWLNYFVGQRLKRRSHERPYVLTVPDEKWWKSLWASWSWNDQGQCKVLWQ